jgi:transposase
MVQRWFFRDRIGHILKGQNVAEEKGSDRHITCPHCRFRENYKLSDGRYKCKRCKKRFTWRKQTCKLPRSQLKEIVRLFWLLVPAERAARDLGLNRKTVQKYYLQLRHKIAQTTDKEALRLSGEVEVDESYFGGHQKGKRGRGAGGKIPVFGLLKRQGIVKVLIPENVQQAALHKAIKTHVIPDSIVYSDGYRAYNNLDLEGFQHIRINHNEVFVQGKVHINGIENFWGFAKRRLKLYHGGFKANFYLFLKEMEFRFNNRDDTNAINKLFKMVLTGPT